MQWDGRPEAERNGAVGALAGVWVVLDGRRGSPRGCPSAGGWRGSGSAAQVNFG